MSLITSAIAASIPSPVALLQFRKDIFPIVIYISYRLSPFDLVGIKKTATQSDSNDFDLASLAGCKKTTLLIPHCCLNLSYLFTRSPLLLSDTSPTAACIYFRHCIRKGAQITRDDENGNSA